MKIDLFQISQMHDIYYTLHLWAILSPRLSKAEQERKTEKDVKDQLNSVEVSDSSLINIQR